MKGSTRAATALAIGYLLGRRRKFRTAAVLAADEEVTGEADEDATAEAPADQEDEDTSPANGRRRAPARGGNGSRGLARPRPGAAHGGTR